jgi:hypothetical protein
MRLLIYLLALIGGFSAAEAARAEMTPASSVAQSAVAAAEALAAQEQESTACPANDPPRASILPSLLDAAVTPIAQTPVTRRDVSLQ